VFVCVCVCCVLVSLEAAKMVSHGIVTARLDYCNSLLHGTSARNLNRLQVAQNELARVDCDAPRYASATELRRHLHWLPVRQRIDYKLAPCCRTRQDQRALLHIWLLCSRVIDRLVNCAFQTKTC